MSPPAVVQGSFADLKFIRGRKVCQMIIELPIEAGGQIVAMFGAPNPEAEVPVAVARLVKSPEILESAKPVRPLTALPAPQQAALCCQNPVFQTFLWEQGISSGKSEDAAASAVRDHCRVVSRADLRDPEPAERWLKLYDKFQAWKAAA